MRIKRFPLFFACFLLFWSGDLSADKRIRLVLPDLDGKIFSLEEELGKGPIVFDFWATWCKPCIKGLPKLQEIGDQYREKGVRVITINIDGPRNLSKIRPFLQRYGLKLPVLLDETNEVMKQFQLVAVPSTLIISAAGELVFKHQGYRPGDEKKLREKLDELLGADAPERKGGEGE